MGESWQIIIDDGSGTILGSTFSKEDAEAILASDWLPGRVIRQESWPVVRDMIRIRRATHAKEGEDE